MWKFCMSYSHVCVTYSLQKFIDWAVNIEQDQDEKQQVFEIKYFAWLYHLIYL